MEKRTENQAKEIKLITVSYTGEYEILTVVPKLGAQKVYDPNDYPELEPIMDEFGSMVDSIWVGTTTTDGVKVQVDYMGYWVAERIENASGDDEVMDYIPDLVSQYFQVLHQVQGEIEIQPFVDRINKAIKDMGQEEYSHYENFDDYKGDSIQARVGYQVIKMLENKN